MAITKATASSIAPAAKGDLVVGSGTNDAAVLAVASTAGYLLSVDSAESTGLKWAAPAAAGYVGCSVYKSADQSISTSTNTAITFNTEDFDTDAFHSTSSNTSRFTVPAGKAGKYLLNGNLNWDVNSNTRMQIYILKNGSNFSTPAAVTGDDYPNLSFSLVISLAVNDYVEVAGYQESGGSINVSGTSGATRVQFSYLGA